MYNIKAITLYFKNKGIIIKEKVIKMKLIKVLITYKIKKVNAVSFEI